jgi:hypothetical protein
MKVTYCTQKRREQLVEKDKELEHLPGRGESKVSFRAVWSAPMRAHQWQGSERSMSKDYIEENDILLFIFFINLR